MTGWATIERIRKLEEMAAKFGLRIREPERFNTAYSGTTTYNGFWVDEVSTDNISLTPTDDRHPCWGRNSAVFTGTVEEARFFLQGVEFVAITDNAIGLSNNKKRAQVEAKYIERRRREEETKKKRAEQKKVWDILKHGQEDEEVPF